MAYKFFTFLFFIIAGLNTYSQPEKKLAEAFIQSVAKNNFQLLEPYLYNAVTAKRFFPAEFAKATPAKQAEAMKKYKSNIQKKWTIAVSNARSNPIDFTKLQVKQVISEPLEGIDIFNSLIITYQYNGVEWDDLFLIINKQGATKYIIDIPNDTRMFALNEDRRGKNLEAMKENKDRKDPNVKLHLRTAVEELKKLIAANDEEAIYKHIVYSGEDDKENRWRRTINTSRPEDIESAKRLLEKLKTVLGKCDQVTYGEVKTEKESEGVWYVINTVCGSQKHTFAFLKINNAFALGDMD